MKIIVFIVCATLFCASCSTKKKLMKGDDVYTFSVGNDPAGVKPAYSKYRVIATKKVTIVDNGSYLIIKDDPAADAKHYTLVSGPILFTKPRAVWKPENMGSAYFAEGEDQGGRSSLWYREGKFVLQTASIPLKIRPSIRNPVYLDSFPSVTETGFSIGFLAGWKFSWNKFRTSQNILGQTTDKFSITPGLILSTSAADLSTATTRPKIVFPRKAAMISTGAAVVFGFNTLNIGYAVGWDHATGRNNASWIYRGKVWHGIIVSLDLIK